MADLSLSRPHIGCSAKTAPEVRLTVFQRIFGVWRQRQHLDRLDAHMRRDIGVTDAQIHREVERPIWDVPTTWRL
ncbi:DUF1127 domain-containing protein [Gymnodinialimonas hymeniacidonis]|uniref:DUF1127 domain-containing protein n=1 Tax=Gymnodinialimonas hymeniacidonis TaxID=3126508 RepID=UPI0034C68079